jgi:eukaryotic-like serine/threonine-protein kinase
MDCPACHQPNIDGARFCAKCGALLPDSPTGDDPLIGAIVGGRFRITGILGEGGMGRVYTGEQQMGTKVRKVAVKTLLAQYAKDPQVLARFMRECGTVSELEHPNTIKVFDFGQTDSGELYIAMELLSGVSLEKALEAGPLHADRVDRILGQVCGSLQEAHDKGIVHRDLKPANIYLTVRAGQDDYVKVLDFGIAKHDEQSAKQEEKLTQQGTVLGTPPYMSPEQFKGAKLDARSDIYALGVVTYEMLTGRLPFDADTPWLWATQHMTAQPFPFETLPLGSQVPTKMRGAVMRALSKDAGHRQQTVTEFYDELTLGAARPTAASGPRSSLPEGQAHGGTAVMSSTSTPPPGFPTVGMPSADAALVPTLPAAGAQGTGRKGLYIGVGVGVLAIAGTVLYLTLGREDDAARQACKATIAAANAGKVAAAVEHYKTCAGGTKGAARNAIDGAALRAAVEKGCSALEDARAAEKAGLPAAANQLKAKHCH